MKDRIIPPARYLTLLCHQVWASDTFLPSITEVPILFLSGLQDEIVPFVPLSFFPPAYFCLNDDPIFHPQNLTPFWDLITTTLELSLTNNPHFSSPVISNHIYRLLAETRESRPSHMRRLFEICQTPMKVWKPLPGGDHNSSVLEVGYFEAITDFVGNLDTKSDSIPARRDWSFDGVF
jgi:hypothetical protein